MQINFPQKQQSYEKQFSDRLKYDAKRTILKDDSNLDFVILKSKMAAM